MTGLVYIPTSTINSFSYAAEPKFNPQPGRMTGTVRPAPTPVRPPPPAIGPPPIEGPGGRGALVAWDPVAQQMRWRMPGGGGIGGGTLTTAGNLVFQVLSDGRLSPTAPTRARSCSRFKPACAAAWDRRSPIAWTASSTSR